MLLVITAVAAAVVAVTTVVGAFTNSIDSMAESFDKANQRIEDSQSKLESYKKAQTDAATMFDDFRTKANLTAEDLDEYNGTLQELSELSPVARHVVDELKAGFIDQEEAARKLNEELERLVENEQKVSLHNLIQRYATYQNEDMTPKTVSSLLDFMDSGFGQWFSGGDQTKGFKAALQNSYLNRSLGKELQDFIKETLESYSKSGYNNTEAWEMVTEDIMYKLFVVFFCHQCIE